MFEAETGRSLERFFEGWIYSDQLPEVRYQWRAEEHALVIRFRQSGDFEFPVTVTLVHEGRTTTEVVIAVTGNESEQRIETPATNPGRHRQW